MWSAAGTGMIPVSADTFLQAVCGLMLPAGQAGARSPPCVLFCGGEHAEGGLSGAACGVFRGHESTIWLRAPGRRCASMCVAVCSVSSAAGDTEGEGNSDKETGCGVVSCSSFVGVLVFSSEQCTCGKESEECAKYRGGCLG